MSGHPPVTTTPSTPSAAPQPAGEDCETSPALVNVTTPEAIDVSPTVDIGHLDVGLPAVNVLTDVVDIDSGTIPGGGLINDLDICNVLSGITAGSGGDDCPDASSSAGSGDGSLVSAVTDADVGVMIGHLASTTADVMGAATVDLADVGAIVGADAIADIAGDAVLDGLVSHTNLLDIPDVCGLLGDHA